MRTFDFLVIGAPMSGTTSLWRGFDSHPEICVPSDKERGFFNSDAWYAKGAERFTRWTFPGATDDQRLGTVTPQLMHGDPERLEVLVERIASTCPEVKLIALLRNPIDRAVSHFRRGLRTGGQANADFDGYTARVARSRGGLERVPFLGVGDYGRILSRYLEAFDREQILILFTEDLDSRPDWLYRRAFTFVGVDPDHPAETARMNVGGTRPRIARSGIDELVAELDRTVWPLVSDDRTRNDARRGFVWWLTQIWNAEPDDLAMDVSPKLRKQLAERYLRDEELLREAFDVEAPWVSSLHADAGS